MWWAWPRPWHLGIRLLPGPRADGEDVEIVHPIYPRYLSSKICAFSGQSSALLVIFTCFVAISTKPLCPESVLWLNFSHASTFWKGLENRENFRRKIVISPLLHLSRTSRQKRESSSNQNNLCWLLSKRTGLQHFFGWSSFSNSPNLSSKKCVYLKLLRCRSSLYWTTISLAVLSFKFLNIHLTIQ